MRALTVITITGICISVSCKKSGDKPAPQEITPAKAELLFPFKDEVCASGQVQSATTSVISFDWKDALQAESYELSLKNLASNIVTLHQSATSDIKITLQRGQPYSWTVTSKTGKSSKTAVSDTWKLYVAGEGLQSYAPYPAEITAPAMGQTVSATAGKVQLKWQGSDADNDITGYNIYFGKTEPLAAVKSNHTGTAYEVEVTANTAYSWRIVTLDAKGNTSESATYRFTVN
ncbi:hypothetical protein [Chitinophaga sp. YIM B06452]|uniref:hypothetical protein n=1 Tax=Chitinophaga sp. YIM B06452 TaxID=3082158 RepID=UPI0031FE6BD4